MQERITLVITNSYRVKLAGNMGSGVREPLSLGRLSCPKPITQCPNVECKRTHIAVKTKKCTFTISRLFKKRKRAAVRIMSVSPETDLKNLRRWAGIAALHPPSPDLNSYANGVYFKPKIPRSPCFQVWMVDFLAGDSGLTAT